MSLGMWIWEPYKEEDYSPLSLDWDLQAHVEILIGSIELFFLQATKTKSMPLGSSVNLLPTVCITQQSQCVTHEYERKNKILFQ